MAEKTMIKAMALSLNLKSQEIASKYKEKGDLGEVMAFFKKQKKVKNPLLILQVYDLLLKISQEKGEGSVERKTRKMAYLLSRIDSLSAKYLARIPLNKLRLGFSEMTILDALSWMVRKDKSGRPELERAFNVLANIGKVASIFKKGGFKSIKKIKSEVGVPIRAAKAERLSTPKEILKKMNGHCVLEPKYDGFRVQIHFDKFKKEIIKGQANENLFLFTKKNKSSFVRIFSRNLDNTTLMFPDIVKAVQSLAVKNVIFDGEAVAYNPRTNKLLDFQKTAQRKRKYGIDKKIKEMPLRVFIFDILYLNGEDLLVKSLKQRRKLLESVFQNSKIDKNKLVLTPQKKVIREADFNSLFQQSVREGLEGLMAKKLDATYQAGARNFNWVKYKVAMQSELADTIDCVVMGYYQGRGKRTAFGLGAFLVGIFSKGNFLTVSKIGTGLTDKQLKKVFKILTKLKVENKPLEYIVNKNLNPDVWCRPELVVEIEADTITKSPIHSAGLALRFPRLKRFREDKDAIQVTTLKELKNLTKL